MLADGDGEADIHLAADRDQGVGIEATVGLHRELSSGPAVAHPPHRKLRRKVPRVDGALTAQPMAPVVPPVRNTSVSSMQSPPASAEATRVSILSPVFARPGASPRSTWLVDEFPQTQVLGEGHRKEQPSIGHQAVVVEGDLNAVGVLMGEHLFAASGH